MVFARQQGKLEKERPDFFKLQTVLILTIRGQSHLFAVVVVFFRPLFWFPLLQIKGLRSCSIGINRFWLVKLQAVLDTVQVTSFVQSHVVPAILMAAVVRLTCT